MSILRIVFDLKYVELRLEQANLFSLIGKEMQKIQFSLWGKESFDPVHTVNSQV